MSEGPFAAPSTGFGSDEDVLVQVGSDLRKARQRHGEDLYDIADQLRIKPSYLFALEEGDLGPMPGMPYALGFLRSYADHLGLDGPRLVRRVKAARSPASGASERLYPLPVAHERRAPFGMLLASLLVVVLGYGGWAYLTRSTDPVLDTVAVAPVLTSSLVSEAPPPPASSSTAPRAPDATPAAQAVEPGGAPGSVVAAPIDLQASPDTAQAATAGAPPGDAMAGSAAPGDPPLPLEASPVPAPDATTAPDMAAVSMPPIDTGRPNPGVGAASASEARVVLIATEPSWIQVRSADRQFSRSRLMAAGEHFPLPERPDLALWTGNAGGLQVLLDGSQIQPLGPRGAVLKNVPLDPTSLKARSNLP